MSLKDIRKLLQIEFWAPIVVCLALIIPFENDLLIAGAWQDDKISEYYVAIVMEIVTICLIPLSLRLFKFKAVRAAFRPDPLRALKRWASIRMAMLTVPMMVNCWLYYQFMNVAFGYMGIIDLLCLVFVYPSKTRCESETTLDKDKSESTAAEPEKTEP